MKQQPERERKWEKRACVRSNRKMTIGNDSSKIITPCACAIKGAMQQARSRGSLFAVEYATLWCAIL